MPDARAIAYMEDIAAGCHPLADDPRDPSLWRTIDTLPPPGERPGRVFVIVEGEKCHSGICWRRQEAGIAATQNDGFSETDIAYLERRGDMDRGSGNVTHWLPINLPHFPR